MEVETYSKYGENAKMINKEDNIYIYSKLVFIKTIQKLK